MNSTIPSETDVVIVGAGPVGLALSVHLSAFPPPYGPVKHVLLEKYPKLSKYPKATGLNQRTVETFRRMGVDKDISDVAADRRHCIRLGWYTTLGRESPAPDYPYKDLLGRQIYSRNVGGGGFHQERWDSASPTRSLACSQLAATPVLLRHARERAHPETQIAFSKGVAKVEPPNQDGGLTTVVLEDGSQIKAKYVIVADGGRTCTQSLGIEMQGHKKLIRMVSAHFKAPELYAHLTKVTCESGHGPTGDLLIFLVNPEFKGTRESGFLYHIGPYARDIPKDNPECGKDWEWVYGMAYQPGDPEQLDEQTVLKRLRLSLNIPDLDVDMVTFSHWYVEAVNAETFSVPAGSPTPSVFLIGDAAHRIPPFGALGLNTGIGDVSNLAWKLALALQSPKDYGRLLSTFNTERRPLTITTSKHTIRNWAMHKDIIDATVGITPDKSVEECWESVRELFANDAEALKRSLPLITEHTEFESAAHGMEIGYQYFQGALALDEDDEIVDAEAEAEKRDLGLPWSPLIYTAMVKTGHFLPHAWVRSLDGRKLSTIDIVKPPRLALLTGPGSYAVWKEAVKSSSRPQSKIIDVSSISPQQHFSKVHADFIAIDEQWTPFDVGSGAILVRPDGIVAWVARRGENDHRKVLETALETIFHPKLKSRA